MAGKKGRRKAERRESGRSIPPDVELQPLIISGNETDISGEEKEMLERLDGFEDTLDNRQLSDARLDHTDRDGEELNESSFGSELTGTDLDIDPLELDDEREAVGAEDEENNLYSPEQEDEDGKTLR